MRQHFNDNNEWVTCSASVRNCKYQHRVVPDVLRAQIVDKLGGQTPYTYEPVTLKSFKNTTTVLSVQEPGVTGKRCRKCGESFSIKFLKKVDQLKPGQSVSCKCGHVLTWDNAVEAPYVVDINRKDYGLVVNADEVLSRPWFHSTSNPNWWKDVNAPENKGLFVHTGSRDAAEDRLSHVLEWSNDPNEEMYIFELEIRPGTKVQDDVMWDENRWPDTVKDNKSSTVTPIAPQGVTRYVNQWENPGEVSLIASPGNYVVKKVHKIRKTTPAQQKQVEEQFNTSLSEQLANFFNK